VNVSVVSDLLREAADRDPGSPAILHGDRRASFGELSGMASGAFRGSGRSLDAHYPPGGRTSFTMNYTDCPYVAATPGGFAARAAAIWPTGGGFPVISREDTVALEGICGRRRMGIDRATAVRPRVDPVPPARRKPKGVLTSESSRTPVDGYLPLHADDRTLAILPFYYSYGTRS
jgi:hypothetical protein